MDKVTVLIVDDQRLIREGIASLVCLYEGVEVVGTASNGKEAVDKARELNPDVIFMDIRMPVLDGIASTEKLVKESFTGKILMLSTFDDEEYIIRSLKAGALGYLLKDSPAEELVLAARQVKNGTYQLAPGVMDKLMSRLSHSDKADLDPAKEKLISSLSAREIEILKQLGKGATNREIAATLNLSEGTVKNYVSAVLSSLDLRDRTAAALFANQNLV